MRLPTAAAASWFAMLLILGPRPLAAQTYEAGVVDGATQVLNEIMATPARQIPVALLADAKAIAIIPNLVKGGFVIGVRHGRGVVVVRDENGAWKAPVFATLTGGSFGYQVGLQATDVILVFKTRNSVKGLMRGKFTLGLDAAVAAGPVGREASAATDATLKAEIYSYSRSRGLFAGLAIDGSALQIDARANTAYYGTSLVPIGVAPLPPSAVRLLETVARHTSAPGAAPGPAVAAPGPPAPRDPLADAQLVRRQLAGSARQLYALLDDNWKKYLALPNEIFADQGQPTADALNQAVIRFDNVAKIPQYQSLAQRPEFQTTYGLLKKYASLQTVRTSSTLALPPPPR
jgi:lipid-binding SYLF domain-containing protein